MAKKTTKQNALKYGKMSFEDFWKEYKENINKDRKLEYKQASKFKRFFMDEESSLLNKEFIQVIAHNFFDQGRLQMISEINMEHLQKN